MSLRSTEIVKLFRYALTTAKSVLESKPKSDIDGLEVTVETLKN